MKPVLDPERDLADATAPAGLSPRTTRRTR